MDRVGEFRKQEAYRKTDPRGGDSIAREIVPALVEHSRSQPK
jgi:hypothetical protein